MLHLYFIFSPHVLIYIALRPLKMQYVHDKDTFAGILLTPECVCVCVCVCVCARARACVCVCVYDYLDNETSFLL